VLNAPEPASAESIAKARAAMEQKLKELEAQPPIAAGAAAPASAPQPSKKPKTIKDLPPFPPIPAPPPAVSADKAQRLAELLRKYKAEEITPEEYHQQRAKVLSQP
jgi:hypothetical protein